MKLVYIVTMNVMGEVCSGGQWQLATANMHGLPQCQCRS